jgi:hypothetical protein
MEQPKRAYSTKQTKEEEVVEEVVEDNADEAEEHAPSCVK